ncbi:MAG: type IV pilus twitching motility protein PilT [Nannocystales bacterium]
MLVHGLLDLLLAQDADALVLQPERPPLLHRGGTDVPLSMPPLARELFDEECAELQGQESVEVKGQRFEIVRGPGGATLEIRRPNVSRPSEAAPPEPTTAAVPSPASVPVAPTSSAFESWIQEALRLDASDVFFSSGRRPCMRRGGEIAQLASTPIDATSLLSFSDQLLGADARARLEKHGSADVAWQHGHHRFRAHVFEQADGLAVALRPVRTDPPSLHKLGLPESFHQLTQYRNGLVLMTGTAGSGKSTTLVGLVERLCRTSAKHIVTLEDPIEYRFSSQTALVHQREVGRHVSSFAEGLRAAMREAPDVIFLGELRDRETIAAALSAAETGHLVLSTLHCADSATAVDRIVDVFEDHRQPMVRTQLASVLRAVISQTLLPSTQPPQRVPAYELLLVNTAVAAKIRDGRGHQLRSELHPGRAEGMIPMEATLDGLVREGKITAETARHAAPEASLLRSTGAS